MNHDELKQRHRKERDMQAGDLSLRIHRALSWLKCAEAADEADSRFIFLWIAFNAAYAQELEQSEHLSEQATFRSFLEKLCSLDKAKRIDALVWNSFSGSIRVLLDNPYVFQAFWDFQRGTISEGEWRERFLRGKKSAQLALASGNTPAVLGVMFNRVYTLRNQIVHGGATCGSSVNREQLRDCVNFLGQLVPLIIEVMMDYPDESWGDACYPVIKGKG